MYKVLPTKVLGLILGSSLIHQIYSSQALAAVVFLTDEPTPSHSLNDLAQRLSPNEERFPQPLPDPELPELDDEPVLQLPQETEPAESQPQSELLDVSEIEVIGSTIFEPDVFEPITQPLEGRTVRLSELIDATNAITRLYRSEGYLTSQAVLLEQEVVDGVVQIQIIEGNIEDIQIDGNRRLNDGYIRSRVRRGITSPVRIDKLEDQLRLLRIDPSIDGLQATLQAGSDVGQSVLVINVDEADLIYGEVHIDNDSPPSIGAERAGFDLGFRSPTGLGDNLLISFDRSFSGGSNLLDVSYRLPVNALDGAIQLRTVIDRNEVTEDPFDELDIEGETELYEVTFRQPISRSVREEFALSLGFSFREGQTFVFNDIPTPFGIGPDEDGVSRTSVFRFGQDYTLRDASGAWVARSLFNFGTGLFDATTNDEPIPDSHFFSWLGQIQRVQRIGQRHLLIIQGDLQLTPDSLLPSEQFVIGGRQSVRGYVQNALSGDSGFRFSIEDRITAVRNDSGRSIFQVAPFADLGVVFNSSDNPNDLPENNFIAGVGLGLILEPISNLNLRIDYAPPLIDLNEFSDNIQADGVYFSVSYDF